jgi:predicted porin
MSFVAFGGSGGADATGTGPDSQGRQRFKRREAGLTYYESPVFSGFQVLGAFSSGNAASDNAAIDQSANKKPRIWSLGGTYNNGPLAIGAGYEKHKQFGAFSLSGAPPAADLDDKGWGISAAYTFAGKVKLGGTYLDRNWQTAPGRNLKKKTWTIGVDWAIAGPHSVQAQYAQAQDSKGNSLLAINESGGGGAAPHVLVGGTEVARSDTGAKDWEIAYSYAFSKRTRVKFGYHKTDNDNNAAYKLGNVAPVLTRGDSQSAWAFHIQHRF